MSILYFSFNDMLSFMTLYCLLDVYYIYIFNDISMFMCILCEQCIFYLKNMKNKFPLVFLGLLFCL
jgi:hypothetical protein